MAGQAIPEAEEFPEQRLAVLRELGEVDAALRAADRGDERDRKDVEQIVALGIASPRVGDPSKGVDQGHVSFFRHTSQNPDHPERKALFFKCDSPAADDALPRRRGEARRGTCCLSIAVAPRAATVAPSGFRGSMRFPFLYPIRYLDKAAPPGS